LLEDIMKGIEKA